MVKKTQISIVLLCSLILFSPFVTNSLGYLSIDSPQSQDDDSVLNLIIIWHQHLLVLILIKALLFQLYNFSRSNILQNRVKTSNDLKFISFMEKQRMPRPADGSD